MENTCRQRVRFQYIPVQPSTETAYNSNYLKLARASRVYSPAEFPIHFSIAYFSIALPSSFPIEPPIPQKTSCLSTFPSPFAIASSNGNRGVRSVPCRTASTASSGSTAGRYVTGLEDSLKLAVMFYFWISFPIVHYYYGIYIHFFFFF